MTELRISWASKDIINGKFWRWLLALSVFARPIHELGHWVVYSFYGIKVHYTLNQVVPYQLKDTKILGEAGGPILNAILAVAGYTIFRNSKSCKEFGLALSIANIFSRLIVYLGVMLLHTWEINDEGVIGILTSKNVYCYYILFGTFFLFLLFLDLQRISMTLKERKDFLLLTILVFGAGILIAEIFQRSFFEDLPVDFRTAIKLLQTIKTEKP